MRSAPVTTRSTSPRAITEAAATSAISRWGIPSRTHSQAVSREPCMTGTRLVHPHERHLALRVGGADHAERGAVAGGGQSAGVAVGEDARASGHQRGAVVAHGAVGADVFLTNRLRLGQ